MQSHLARQSALGRVLVAMSPFPLSPSPCCANCRKSAVNRNTCFQTFKSRPVPSARTPSSMPYTAWARRDARPCYCDAPPWSCGLTPVARTVPGTADQPPRKKPHRPRSPDLGPFLFRRSGQPVPDQALHFPLFRPRLSVLLSLDLQSLLHPPARVTGWHCCARS